MSVLSVSVQYLYDFGFHVTFVSVVNNLIISQYFSHLFASTQQAHSRGSARFGDVFWGKDVDHTQRRSALPAGQSSPLRGRSTVYFRGIS
ncbi:hypothetical protein M405DRAFT_867537 [Rhizopogon salebrosus TDB-379]|nr:hypothetical protein M405DRAFT_867537 [Rhizopogon salebrosus TDB-379]